METKEKTFASAAEQMQEAFKSTADIYKQASLSILEAYNKQLSTSAEWYNNFVGSTLKTDFSKNYEAASDLLKKNMENYQRTLTETSKLSKEVTEKIFRSWSEEESFFSPVSKEVTEAVLSIFKKQSALLNESGAQFLSTIYKEENLKASSEQFKGLMGSAIKTSEQTIKNLIDTYNKEAEFTQKASEQLLRSITKQFDAITEMNTQLFNDSLKNFEQEKSKSSWNPFAKEKATDGKTNKTNKQ
ncbi:MAG: hypothetical protein HY063_05205 [Bacteroidetes bacterium]|nr:hypothetical protein [Bacteroidota bacterium]